MRLAAPGQGRSGARRLKGAMMSQSGPFAMTVCPRCSSQLRIKQSSLGKTIGCAHCEHRFVAQASLGLDESSGDYTAPPVAKPDAEERIEISCPECTAGLSVRAIYVGQHVRCRKCNHKFLVVKPADSSLPSRLESTSSHVGLDTLDLLARLSSPGPGSNDLQQAHDALQAAHHEIQAAHDELQTAHARLQAEYDAFAPEYSRLAALGAQLAGELEETKADRDRLASELSEIKSDLETLRHEIGSLSLDDARQAVIERDRLAEQAGGLREEANRLRGELEAAREESRAHHQSARESEERASALAIEIEGHKAEIEQHKVEIEGHKAEIVERLAEATDLEEARSTLEARLRAAEEVRLEMERASAADQARIESLVASESRAESDLQNALERGARLEGEIQELTNRLSDLREAASRQAALASPVADGRAELESEFETTRSALDLAHQRIAILERSNREMTVELGRMGVGPIRRRS